MQYIIKAFRGYFSFKSFDNIIKGVNMFYDEMSIMNDCFYLNGELKVEVDWGQRENDIQTNKDCGLTVIEEWLYNSFTHHELCPYCSTRLSYACLIDNDLSKNDYLTTYNEHGGEIDISELKVCLKCKYWQWILNAPNEKGDYGCYDSQVHAAISKSQEFDVNLPYGFNEEIAIHMRRNPKIWNKIDPYKLEHLVHDIYKDNFSDCEVTHVGRTGDGVVDITLINTNEVKHLIQVKRRIHSKRGEGVNTLRNLLGVMAIKNEKNGIVVSTADHFTYQANKERNLAEQNGFIVEFVSKKTLDKMLDPLLPHAPWEDFIKLEYPDCFEKILNAIEKKY